MLTGLLKKARVYDFRGVLVDAQGEMLPDADLRLSYDKSDRHARPIIICTEPIEDAFSLAKRVNLPPDLILSSFFSLFSAVERRDQLKLRPKDFLDLSTYISCLGLSQVESYITSSFINVVSANKANTELRTTGVKREGHIYFPRIGLINPTFSENGRPITDRPKGSMIYMPIRRLMKHF